MYPSDEEPIDEIWLDELNGCCIQASNHLFSKAATAPGFSLVRGVTRAAHDVPHGEPGCAAVFH